MDPYGSLIETLRRCGVCFTPFITRLPASKTSHRILNDSQTESSGRCVPPRPGCCRRRPCATNTEGRQGPSRPPARQIVHETATMDRNRHIYGDEHAARLDTDARLPRIGRPRIRHGTGCRNKAE